jgi:hypothetical protein
MAYGDEGPDGFSHRRPDTAGVSAVSSRFRSSRDPSASRCRSGPSCVRVVPPIGAGRSPRPYRECAEGLGPVGPPDRSGGGNVVIGTGDADRWSPLRRRLPARSAEQRRTALAKPHRRGAREEQLIGALKDLMRNDAISGCCACQFGTALDGVGLPSGHAGGPGRAMSAPFSDGRAGRRRSRPGGLSECSSKARGIRARDAAGTHAVLRALRVRPPSWAVLYNMRDAAARSDAYSAEMIHCRRSMLAEGDVGGRWRLRGNLRIFSLPASASSFN